MAEEFRLTVNGTERRVTVEKDVPLLYVLRNDLGLNSPKFGCGLAQCGACTVLVGGTAVRSCAMPVAAVGEEAVTTLEGLGSEASPHPLQKAFIAEQAAQCGYCIAGMIMQAKALLDEVKEPSERDIRDALGGNLCRCGTHVRILRAIRRAAKEMAT